MISQITLKYSCDRCGLKDVEVSVPARQNEDVVAWLEGVVGHFVHADHQRRSPGCRATSVQNLMIPTTGAQKVGGPAIQ